MQSYRDDFFAWEQCKLSDISEKSYEKNTDNKYSTVLTNSAEYGVVKQRDFFDKDIANSSNISGYYVVRKNYFVYNPRISNQAKFGPINRNKLDETGIMSPLYLVFTVHDINESFLETLFQTTTWHRFMYQNGDTGARADRFAIKDSTFMSMPIKVPMLEEQNKLAFAIQKLDHTITLHEEKKCLLERLKSALLQKMFADESGYPVVRFEGFSDEWVQRKLGDVVGEIQSGNRLPKASLTNGDVPYVVAQTKNDGVFQKIARGTLDYNGNPMKLFPGNSISFSIDNPEAMFYRNAEFYTSNIMRVIHEDHLTHEQYVFILENMKRFIRGYDWSRKFSGPVVSNLKYLQPSEEEQQKIGSFFKQLDDTIALHQQKINNINSVKKSLLQKMFI